MKLSISIPDELWVNATKINPHVGVSGLVQLALSQYVARHAVTSMSRPADAGIDEALQVARANAKAKAEELFARGYRGGLELAGQLDFDVLEWWAEAGTADVFATLLEHYESNFPTPFRPEVLEAALNVAMGEKRFPGSLSGADADLPLSRWLAAGVDRALSDVLAADDDAVSLESGDAS